MQVQLSVILPLLYSSSSRIQIGALGHTLTPLCSVCRQFFGFIPGDVHVVQISSDDVHSIFPWPSRLECNITSKQVTNCWKPLYTHYRVICCDNDNLQWAFSIVMTVMKILTIVSPLLQRVSIASYAKRCISYDRFCPTVRPSYRPNVWPSVTVRYHAKTTLATIMRSSLEDSPMI